MRNALLLLPAILMFSFAGCSKAEKKTDDAEAKKKSEEDAEAKKQAENKALAEKYKLQPVDFKKLQEFFPEGTADFAKGEPTGSFETSGNEKTSKATVIYGKEPRTIRVDIIDFAAAKKKIEEAYWWTTRSADSKLKDGFERTGYVQQLYKTYEHQSIEKKTSKYMVYLGERFIVSAEAADVDMTIVKPLIDKLDYRKLAAQK